MDPKDYIHRGIDSYITERTQFMVDEELEKSGATPKVGIRTTQGYACSTYTEPGTSRAFDPDNSLMDFGAVWKSVQGLDDSDIEDDTKLPPAQARRSLLDSIHPVAGHHQSVRLSQSVDRPKHTNPKCDLCPGLPAGLHYCKELGKLVKSCEDCEISRWIPPKPTQQPSSPPLSGLPRVPQPLGNNGNNERDIKDRTSGEGNNGGTKVNTQGSMGTTGTMTTSTLDTRMVPEVGSTGPITNTLNTSTTLTPA